MVEITPAAASQIRALLFDQNASIKERGLRIKVENGGCSGMQYVMSFDSRKPEDQVFRQHDVDVFVDSESLAFVDGSTIDYKSGLTDAGFKVHNPKAKQTCGCGTSFGT